MRYPKAWDADSNVVVGTIHHASEYDGKADIKRHSICLHVFKPGTVDHGRRVIARLTRNEAIKLYQTLESQLAVKSLQRGDSSVESVRTLLGARNQPEEGGSTPPPRSISKSRKGQADSAPLLATAETKPLAAAHEAVQGADFKKG